ncbi:Arylsulfatase [Anaerohalosphaera lusitana]|uniref:Arylsulfatase n=1 Tax=Anaerohalosphaera lusitana TaxID=1936003 RepID=A0A1U9NHE1_9BACT|nr:sulfatase [Anaerohalosphaera lusitana]AQT67341.1 Arylsulfatase [Anaerohalosphaera lusitana]
MNRRDFLRTAGIVTAGLTVNAADVRAEKKSAAENKSKDQRPNVLWIVSEDTSPDFACYGEKLVKTPNVDRLASEGAMFTNAFAACPVCSPTRSAFNTGMYQTTIGAHHHRSHRRDGYKLPEPVKHVSDMFRDAGYYTFNSNGLNWKKPGKLDYNFKLDGNAFDGTDWRDRKNGQPFYGQVNLFLTHRKFKRDKDRPIDADDVKLPPYYPDDPLTRRDWADYLESVQVLDGMIGEVLDRLEADGLADNTVVFYFGDHGRAHLRAKQWLYEGGIRVPLVVRWPDKIAPGTVRDDLVSQIDFVPTSLAACGIDTPDYLQGVDFLGNGETDREYIFAARDRCDETTDRIRCVRTKRFKYIRNFYPDRPYTQMNCYKMQAYPALSLLQLWKQQGKLTDAQKPFMADVRPKEELYDLQSDPWEINNLAGDAKYADKLAELRGVLDKWIEETEDKGQTPEDAQTRKYWQNFFEKRYAKIMKNRGLGEDPSPAQRVAWWREKML